MGWDSLQAKRLAVLLAVAALGLGVGACGGSGRGGARVRGTSTGYTPAGDSEAAREAAVAGSDDNIPAYGRAASPQDRRAVSELVRRYYAAARAHNGAAACAMLDSNLAKSVPEDYGHMSNLPYMHGGTCAAVMSKLFAHLGATSAQLAMPVVTGVRLYRGHGFAELRSKEAPRGELFVVRQGDAWKVGVLIGRERVEPVATKSDPPRLKGDEDDDDTVAEISKLGPADGDNDTDNDPKDNASKGYHDSDDGAMETYGHHAGLADAQTLAALAKRYFVLAAAADGAKACSLIAVPLARAVPEQYGAPVGSSGRMGGTCAAILSKLFGRLHNQLAHAIDVTGVRVSGAQAHVALGSATWPSSYFLMTRERGAWKVDGLLPVPLP